MRNVKRCNSLEFYYKQTNKEASESGGMVPGNLLKWYGNYYSVRLQGIRQKEGKYDKEGERKHHYESTVVQYQKLTGSPANQGYLSNCNEGSSSLHAQFQIHQRTCHENMK